MSEDCLYLNVWTPARTMQERLPVLVFFHGGGFMLEDGSETRNDGEALAAFGIVTVTVNYRLGLFGFLAHPELTAESPYRGSGNYGLLDQVAALRWIFENIATFGGDPHKITISGQSAGAYAVSALMASPLAKDLIAGAIASSGSMMSPAIARPVSLQQAEERGVTTMSELGGRTVAELRSWPASRFQDAYIRLPVVIDGHFLTASPLEAFAAGEQAKVPLMLGWNSQEQPARALLGQRAPSPEVWANVLAELFPRASERALNEYPARLASEVTEAASDLASEAFIGYGMWKWSDLHQTTAGQRVYRYYFAQGTPPRRGAAGDGARASHASHGDDLGFAFRTVTSDTSLVIDAGDRMVMDLLSQAYINFVKTGDPNGAGIPRWNPLTDSQSRVLVIDSTPRVEIDRHTHHFRLIDEFGLTHSFLRS